MEILGISIDVVEKLREYGMLNEIQFRNYCIKEMYKHLGTDGKKRALIVAELSDIFNIAPSTISNILYQKSNRRVPLIIDLEKVNCPNSK